MLSVIIISNEIDSLVLNAIHSVASLQPQLIIGLSASNKLSLGERKQALLELAAHDWVLLLDKDEAVTYELVKNILKVVKKQVHTVGYDINYKNYFLGKPIYYGGESYTKARFFNKNCARVSSVSIHEEVILEGNKESIKGEIIHNSYRSVGQVLAKFTKYAWLMAGEKRKAGERVSLKKLTMYGPHMVWARAVKDQGWRDGWRGIVLALCFGYMETLIYWFLLWRNLFGR